MLNVDLLVYILIYFYLTTLSSAPKIVPSAAHASFGNNSRRLRNTKAAEFCTNTISYYSPR